MAQKYFISNRGKEQLISKKDIKKELGRSPDNADAFAISMNAMIYDDEAYDSDEVESIGDTLPCSSVGGAW